jgi:hypothetical protein
MAAFRDLERLAKEFATDLRQVAWDSGALGGDVIGSLRDILEDTLDRIRSEVFRMHEEASGDAPAPAGTAAADARAASAQAPAEDAPAAGVPTADDAGAAQADPWQTAAAEADDTPATSPVAANSPDTPATPESPGHPATP